MFRPTTTISVISLLLSLSPISSAYAHDGVHSINIEAEAFVPSRVEIQQGETVIFVNADHELHWPASDRHPTHTAYPGSDIRKCGSNEETAVFDACRGLTPGEEYRFTFTDAGEWNFHDHLHPTMQGTITVVGETREQYAPRREELSFGKKIEAWFLHWWYVWYPERGEQWLAEEDMFAAGMSNADLEYWMRIFGYKPVFDRLEHDSRDMEKRKNDPRTQNISGQCHTEGHFAGHVAYELFGIQPLLERQLDTRCQYGFYHGILESSLGANASDTTIREFVQICASYEDEDPLRRLFCEHVIGHGLMVHYNQDLPYALEKCRALMPSERATSMCYDGVFMENAFAALNINVSGHGSRWIDASRPNYPCDMPQIAENPQMRTTCYFNQPAVWGRSLSQFDTEAAVGLCERAPLSARHACMSGIGYYAGHSNAALSDEEVVTECKKMPTTDDRMHCLSGGAFMRGGVWSSNHGYKNPIFCNALGMPDLDACEAYIKSAWTPL